MTDTELSLYYASLLIMQYSGKPRASAMIAALVFPVIMNQIPVAVQNGFDINTAVGAQLDILGKYVGVSRIGNTLNGLVTLGDSDYRTLMKMVIIKNNSGSSLATIQSLLSLNFPGQVLVSDNRTMAINYVIVESLGTSDLLEILVSGGYLPAPMGVQVSATFVPVHTNPFFGFRTYAAADPTVAPFNSYANYQLTYPWFSYGD